MISKFISKLAVESELFLFVEVIMFTTYDSDCLKKI